MLDTKTRPPTQHAEPERRERPKRFGLFGYRDVILGVAMGFVVALGFGGPILSALSGFWSNVVLPAFYTLAQSGLGYCT
jgi:hypothetical protein